MGDLFEFSFSNVSAFENQLGMYLTNMFLDGKYQPSYDECINKIKVQKKETIEAIRDARGDKTLQRLFADKKFIMGKLISVRPTEILSLDKNYSKKIVNYIKTMGVEALLGQLNMKNNEDELYDFIVVNDNKPDEPIYVDVFSYKLYVFLPCETREEFNNLLRQKFTMHFIKYDNKDDRKKYTIISSISEKELYSQ